MSQFNGILVFLRSKRNLARHWLEYLQEMRDRDLMLVVSQGFCIKRKFLCTCTKFFRKYPASSGQTKKLSARRSHIQKASQDFCSEDWFYEVPDSRFGTG